MGRPQRGPTPIHYNNQIAISFARKPATHQRTKHIEVMHHLIREKVEAGTLRLAYVGKGRQQADIFTKSLPMESSTCNRCVRDRRSSTKSEEEQRGAICWARSVKSEEVGNRTGSESNTGDDEQ